MGLCVIHLSKCDNTLIASARIARYICEKTGATLIDRPGIGGNFDTVMFVNSMSKFSDFFDEACDIISRCKRFILIQNDYNITPRIYPAIIERADLKKEVWSTIPEMPKRIESLRTWGGVPHKATHYVNWNMLTYNQVDHVEPERLAVFYYGAFRSYRVPLFQKYFGFPTPYDVFISTSKNAITKFEDINLMMSVDPPATDLCKEIQRFAVSLYLEDSKSNSIYCSPANRFYECLGAGVAIAFDKSSIWTFEQAGYNISNFVVDSKEELSIFIEHYDEIRNKQRSLWARDYRKELDAQFNEAARTL